MDGGGEDEEDGGTMRQPEKMIIYNLFPLLAGKVADWEGHFTRAADMGFNWIFVNPIQNPGLSGSLYSIKDYFKFNPLIIDGRSKKRPMEQVRESVRTAERKGLKMMIDLVINHCAVDSDLIRKHPEWFKWEKNGRVAHPSCNENGKRVVWGDLAMFDFRSTQDREGLYSFFLKVVKFLIETGFRGFRCDAAYQVPVDFWKRLIRETKAFCPEALFLAETLGCTPEQTGKTAGAGFDYIFNSSKWWDFQSSWLMEQYNLTREIVPSVSFPESHDTERLCAELNGNIDGLKQRYLFAAFFSSGVMMPVGFEFGFRKRLHVVKTRPMDWENTGINLLQFIGKVNDIKERHLIFSEDAPTEILESSNPNVLVMRKASVYSNEKLLLILNKDIYYHQNFSIGRFADLMQSGDICRDISPEYPLDYLPEPFSYDLRPGQGIVLIAAGS